MRIRMCVYVCVQTLWFGNRKRVWIMRQNGGQETSTTMGQTLRKEDEQVDRLRTRKVQTMVVGGRWGTLGLRGFLFVDKRENIRTTEVPRANDIEGTVEREGGGDTNRGDRPRVVTTVGRRKDNDRKLHHVTLSHYKGEGRTLKTGRFDRSDKSRPSHLDQSIGE